MHPLLEEIERVRSLLATAEASEKRNFAAEAHTSAYLNGLVTAAKMCGFDVRHRL